MYYITRGKQLGRLAKAGWAANVLISNLIRDLVAPKKSHFQFTREWLYSNYSWLTAYAQQQSAGRLEASSSTNEITQVKLKLPVVNFFELYPEARNLVIPMDTQYSEWNISPTELYYLNCIAKLRGAKRIFEFGTYNGATAYQLAKTCPDSEVVTIEVPAYTASFIIGSRYHGTLQEKQIRQLIGDSQTYDYSEFWETVDVVFVDADHRYEGAKADSLTALKLVKPDGVIVWDDYDRVWPDVVRAINELIQEYPVVSIQGTKFAVLDLAKSSSSSR
jgi:predicted O-methyltransferase YrrM